MSEITLTHKLTPCLFYTCIMYLQVQNLDIGLLALFLMTKINRQTDSHILLLVKRQQVAKKEKLAKSVFAALAAGLAGERERDCQVDQQTRSASY